VIDENENQDTRESPALSADALETPPEAETAAAAESAPTPPEGTPTPADEPPPTPDTAAASAGEVTFSDPGAGHAGGQSPAAAQARAESGDQSPLERPEVQILGAFVGAFILAKLLQRLFSRD
jgi:hypothetical protein